MVIPNYNGRSFLPDCISSLLAGASRPPELEIIVVDNGSVDESVKWLKCAQPHVRVLENTKNLGFARAVNRGVRAASGEFVALLNADMRVDTNWLSSLLSTLHKAPNMVCSGSIVLDWKGESIDYAGRPDDALNLLMRPRSDSSALASMSDDSPLLFASGGAMLVRRADYLELGGFDEDYFLYNEDVDFGWRLWLRGGRVLRSVRSRVFHRGGASAQELGLERVMFFSQSSTLCTMIKMLGEEELRRALPLVLYSLVNRGKQFPEAQRSLGDAVDSVLAQLPTLLEKREVVQATRVRTDADLFGEVGHPLGGVLADPDVSRFAGDRRVQRLLGAAVRLAPAPFARHVKRALRCASRF